jgi:hypothetical protein
MGGYTSGEKNHGKGGTMELEPVYHKTVEEMEKEFRRLRRSVLGQYEAEIERAKQELVIRSEDSSRIYEQTRDILKEAGVDVDKLDRLEQEEEENLEEFLSRVVPKFTEREVDPNRYHRERIIRVHYYTRLGGHQPVCIGADLLGSDMDQLKEIKGGYHQGNPSVWFSDPSDVRDVRVSMKGRWETSACGTAVGMSHKTVIWWFSFIPQVTGAHWFLGSLPYQGFYGLRSNDTPLTCKFAEVDAVASIDIYQYFWHGARNYRVFHRHEKDVSTADYLSGHAVWDFHTYLAGGDKVDIKLAFTISAVAKGGGSYAQVDFDTGDANRVGPPELIIGE